MPPGKALYAFPQRAFVDTLPAASVIAAERERRRVQRMVDGIRN